MEIRWDVFMVIVGASIVTLLPRIVPLIVLSRFELPNWAMRWLNFVPISVMAALVGQELFKHDGKIQIFTHNLELFAAIPAFVMAIVTRSILATVLAGVITLMILRFFF